MTKNTHTVKGHIEGDWIVFQCRCGWERRFNPVIGKMKSNDIARQSDVQHTGAMSPDGESLSLAMGNCAAAPPKPTFDARLN